MSKATQFKQRVQAHGQTITRIPFAANATGTYVDGDWHTPDPEAASYPATGTPPGPTYGTPQSILAFVQPARGGNSGQRFVKTPLGEEVAVQLRAFVAYDVTLTFKDRLTVDGSVYWIARVEDWREAGALVYRLAWLAQEVA